MLFVSALVAAQTPTPLPTPLDRNTPSCTLQLEFHGVITPGSLDYLDRGIKRAEELRCASLLLTLNTPGGGLETTRLIVEKILASPVPVLCLVSPSGGHAGSAGAIVLLACHVSGALPATNIGAATPISASGEKINEDLRRKLHEDTVAWVKGLAKMRGRSLVFAEEIITKAKSLDADDAAKAGGIDKMALDLPRFLEFAEGRQVVMKGDQKMTVHVGALTTFRPDVRFRVLQLVTDPEIAYLLFMASLALLYFEFTHPGVGVAGVVGGIGLIVSLVAFHRMDVWWGGVSLIALGLAMLAAEAFIGVGFLGVGGILALAAGSFFLFDPAAIGVGLPASLIVVTCGILGTAMLTLAFIAFRTHRRGGAIAEVALIGQVGEVASLETPSARKGMAFVGGETWHFQSARDVAVGDKIKVLSQEEGLTLRVEPAFDSSNKN